METARRSELRAIDAKNRREADEMGLGCFVVRDVCLCYVDTVITVREVN